MRVEEQYADILLNIETAIVQVYDNRPELTDRDVLSALESLQRGYEKEKRKRDGLTPEPSSQAGVVYAQIRRVCEWCLGREQLNQDEQGAENAQPEELTIAELLRILKRLHKSVRLWNKQGGRQGYLKYVAEFIST